MINKKLLSIFIFVICGNVFASGRLDFSYGYFSINSKADNKETKVSNPSAMNVAYLYPILEKLHLNFGYSVLLADFSGSDKGYGLNLGFNYYLSPRCRMNAAYYLYLSRHRGDFIYTTDSHFSNFNNELSVGLVYSIL